MTTTIEVRDVCKTYFDRARGQIHALDHVSFSVQPGEIVGLLGPNGAGKTTLLRILIGLMKPNSGSVLINGIDPIQNSKVVRSQIGYVTTTTRLYGRLTPTEVLELFGKLNNLNSSLVRERSLALIHRFGLLEFCHSPCEKLSTGQKQRVNLARAFIHEPPIILLDEPTSGLDILTSQVISETLIQAKQQGKSILLCTHNIADAELVCDRIAVLHEGQLRAYDTLNGINTTAGETNLTRSLLKVLRQ